MTYWVDVDVRPFLNANVVWPIVRPFPVTVDADHVRAVTFSTICVLDSRRPVNTHCMPTHGRINHSSVRRTPHDMTVVKKNIDKRKKNMFLYKMDGRQVYHKIIYYFLLFVIIYIRMPSDIFISLVVLHDRFFFLEIKCAVSREIIEFNANETNRTG